MALLVLNGVTLPAALGEVSREEPLLIGEEARSESGSDLSNVRARKESWKARLTPQVAATAAAIRALVQGEGYSWSFDSDLYADRKGLGPSSGSAIHVAGNHSSCASAHAAITMPVNAGAAWTIMGWVWKPSVLAWAHFLRLSDGTKYKNGVATADDPLMNISGTNLVLTPEITSGGLSPWAATTVYADGSRILESSCIFEVGATTSGTNGVEPNWATATGLGAEIEEDPGGGEGGPWTWTNVNTGFDDVLFLPAKVPATWVAQLYAEAAARAWTPLPRLRLAGDVAAGLSAGYATVTGKVGGVNLVRGRLGGSLVGNAEPLELELREA